MYNGCTENTSCKFKSEKGTCLLLTSTEGYIDETCPFLAPLEPIKQKTKKKSNKSYELDRFCRIYCKHYIPGVDWNTTRERKGYCSICPLANHVKVE